MAVAAEENGVGRQPVLGAILNSTFFLVSHFLLNIHLLHALADEHLSGEGW